MRGNYWIEHWHSLVRKLEPDALDNIVAFRLRGVNVRIVAYLLLGCFAFLWGISLLYYVYLLWHLLK